MSARSITVRTVNKRWRGCWIWDIARALFRTSHKWSLCKANQPRTYAKTRRLIRVYSRKFAAKNLVFAEASATAAASAATTTTVSATASATSSAPAKAAASSASTTKSAATRLGPRFIHVKGARPQLIAVHGVDGLVRLLVVGHLHKGEPTRLPRVTVRHDRYLIDLPVSCKSLSKFFFTDVEIQIAYVNVLHIILFMLECRRQATGDFRLVDVIQKTINLELPFAPVRRNKPTPEM